MEEGESSEIATTSAPESDAVAKPAETAPDEAGPSETAEVKEKKNRRRSSIGGEILNIFLKSDCQETMSPVEVRPARPRRAAQLRVAPIQVAAPVVPRQKPIKYYFDVGERVETKSCLKPTTAPILLHKGLQIPKKSVAQRAAAKIVEKYKNVGNVDKTPVGKREGQLKFHNVCTIRVITPRPEYNPDHLEMPHSDDEEEPALNPNRERLSTVELRLTPTSERQLEELKDNDVFQFNAEMVFGDRDERSPPLSDEPETAVEASEEPKEVATTSEAVVEAIEQPVKKKSSRRKSLIVGGASPMKIEKPRFEEEMEEQISEPKRRNRRSTRLQSISSSEKVSTSASDSDSVEILEEAAVSKKRELVVESEQSTSSEPLPKKNRRKSQGPLKLDAEEVKKPGRRKSCKVTVDDVPKPVETAKIHDFFTPKPSKKVEEKVKTTDASKRRRSTRFVIQPSDDVSEILENEQVVIQEMQRVEVIQEADEEVPATPSVSKKIAPLFMTTPRTPQAQDKQEAAPKLFSLFSPKPKPKVETDPSLPAVVDLTTNSPTISTESTSKNEPLKKIGIKREERWGDYHPENYQFMSNMLIESVTSQPEPEDNPIFTSRHFDRESLKPQESFRLRDRPDADEVALTVLKSSDVPREFPEKIETIQGFCPLTVAPSVMEELNEAGNEEVRILKWLKDWKKRVRKEAEKEMKQKNKKEKKPKRSKRRMETSDEESDDDSGDDYVEEDVDELENPLVLIGPTGVGKSALIRVLAKQENMRIISMGPETERTGSEIKKKLQEAMRSHRVDQNPSKSLTNFFANGKDMGGYKRREKSPTVLDKGYTQSLIVFEHVDVFFDSLDRHGVTALLETVNDAVVPVIFTAESADWPRFSGNIELRRQPFEVTMMRKEERTWKCVQKLIYSCRNVFIDDSTMQRLSQSVDHDLQGLLRQAHFYALSPDRPLPLTSRELASDGFSANWELEINRKPSKCHKNSERAQELFSQYSKICEVDGLFHFDSKPLMPPTEFSDGIQTAYEALRGRYSRRQIAEDMLPFLVPMDRVEKKKEARNRRHLHLFKTHSDNYPIDAESLIGVVRSWRIKKTK